MYIGKPHERIINMVHPLIVGVLGRSRVGKDTFAKVVCENPHYRVKRLAAPLKQAVTALYGFTPEQLEGAEKEDVDMRWNIRPRDAMIQLTQDTMAFMGRDFFTRRFWDVQDHDHDHGIIIPDVRYEHDLGWIRMRGGIIVKIVRNHESQPLHEAENHIDAINDVDMTFENNGSLLEFEKSVRDWWTLLGLKNLTVMK